MGNTYWKICEMLNKNAYLNIIILYFAGQSLYYFFWRMHLINLWATTLSPKLLSNNK